MSSEAADSTPGAADNRRDGGEGGKHLGGRDGGMARSGQMHPVGDRTRIGRHQRGQPDQQVGRLIEVGALERAHLHLRHRLEDGGLTGGECPQLILGCGSVGAHVHPSVDVQGRLLTSRSG